MAAIRDLELARMVASATPPHLLLLEQAGGAAGRILTRHGGATGRDVTVESFPEYAGLLTDPTSARVPEGAIQTIVNWLTTHGRASQAYRMLPWPAACGLLQGDGFVEQPLRFGPDACLAGVLCLPEQPDQRQTALVIANAGRDYHVGWGRAAVVQARVLAHRGIASLRFDVSGIGDSRAASDGPREVLYSPRMCADLSAAVDVLHDRGYRSLGLLGRCSGAWASFTVAATDARIAHLVLVNTAYFLWDSSKNLEDLMRFSQRSVGDLRATLMRRDGLSRLVAGRLDWIGASRFVLRQANRFVARRAARLLGCLTAESRRYHELHAIFGRLKQRDVRVLLAYAEGDSSLDELKGFMGAGLSRLRSYPNVSVCEIGGADHNFTPLAARDDLLARLEKFLEAEAKSARAGDEPPMGSRRVPEELAYAVAS